MAQFSVNTHRFDSRPGRGGRVPRGRYPYQNFKFSVRWDGRYVAGVSKVGALKRTTEVVKHREGRNPSSSRKAPGRSEYEAITLERGVTALGADVTDDFVAVGAPVDPAAVRTLLRRR